MIPSVVTTAPGVYILPPIDNNFSVPSDLSVKAAAAVVMRRGVVGKPFTITKANWEQLCGKPLPMTAGRHAEGMRQVVDALQDCGSMEVVRVIGAGEKAPVSVFKLTSEKPAEWPADVPFTAPVLTSAKADIPIGGSYELDNDENTKPDELELFACWPVDGDRSENRKVVIDKIDDKKRRFRLQFKELVAGTTDTYKVIAGESYVVGIEPEDKDDLGLTAYLPAVLEEKGSRFRVVMQSFAFGKLREMEASLDNATAGAAPTTDDFKAAWKLLADDEVDFDMAFAAGNYEPAVLKEAISICEGKLAQFRFDVPPELTEEKGIEWIQAAGLNSYQTQTYHYPYKANDEWYGGKAVWGVSGVATASKARCMGTPTGRVDVRGAHFTNAGDKRGLVGRSGVEPLHFTGKVAATELVENRINPVKNGKVISDCLTLWNQENYLRFEHVGAILNDLSHDFLFAANIAKFEPDGLTRKILTDLAKDICDKRVQSGALVTPRNPAQDGKEPFKILIEQVELDLWQVTISVCPTGVARRIAMQPILLK